MSKLRDQIKNREKLELLNSLILPEFEKQFTLFINSNRNRNAVCEIPLLFEKNYQKYFDAVISVWTPDNLRIERLKTYRNMSEPEIAEREVLQYSAVKKMELADYCLINDGSRKSLEKQIDELIENLK